MKIFYFDTETTGLNPKFNDIIQLACIVEIDRKVVDKVNIEMQPFSYENIQVEALKVNGKTIEGLKQLQTPQQAFSQLIKLLDKHIDKYNKNDKFHPAGYNTKFDVDFLKEFFNKNNHKYYGSYFDYHLIDVLQLITMENYLGNIDIPNLKLETACKCYGMKLDAHDAMNDIEATKALWDKLIEQRRNSEK